MASYTGKFYLSVYDDETFGAFGLKNNLGQLTDVVGEAKVLVKVGDGVELCSRQVILLAKCVEAAVNYTDRVSRLGRVWVG